MLSKKAKYLYGCQITVGSIFGSIPFKWNFQKEQLTLVPHHSVFHFVWIIATALLWIHQFTMIFKFIICFKFGCLDTDWIQNIFHIMWINATMFPTFFNYNTVIYRMDFLHVLNKLIKLDEYLTSQSNLHFITKLEPLKIIDLYKLYIYRNEAKSIILKSQKNSRFYQYDVLLSSDHCIFPFTSISSCLLGVSIFSSLLHNFRPEAYKFGPINCDTYPILDRILHICTFVGCHIILPILLDHVPFLLLVLDDRNAVNFKHFLVTKIIDCSLFSLLLTEL